MWLLATIISLPFRTSLSVKIYDCLHLENRFFFFSTEWNQLPHQIVKSQTINPFRIIRHVHDKRSEIRLQFDWWIESKCQHLVVDFSFSVSPHWKIDKLFHSVRVRAKNINEIVNHVYKFSITNYFCVAKQIVDFECAVIYWVTCLHFLVHLFPSKSSGFIEGCAPFSFFLSK